MRDRPCEAVIFDLDGTVYLGDELLPGAAEMVSHLRTAGVQVLFLTNKAISRRDHYSEKLTRLGIPTEPDEVINSGWVTAQYLRTEYPDRRAFVIGEEPLLAELEAAGVEATTDEPGDLLVVSMDRTFTYEKLDLARQTLGGGAPFVATNPDRTCPMPDGAIPDAAGMIGAVEAVTAESVDAILGKPEVTMVETVLGVLDVKPSECLMVGDRPETDIEMGRRAGMTTVLVLSGITDRADLADLSVQPDHVIEGIADLASVFDHPLAVTKE